MARYFMGDTRLRGLERMMMDPSRTASIRTESRRKKPQKKPLGSQPAEPPVSGQKVREGGV